MYKTPHSESTFVSADVEKLYATVAKSIFGSENVKKLRVREHFSKFRCRKIVRHCGETYILKSKCTNHDVFGPLFVLMLKKCTRLWRKAHLEVKIFKTCGVQSTFGRADVENLHAAVAKSTFGSENVQNTSAADSFLKF